jgi:hypothetical protein
MRDLTVVYFLGLLSLSWVCLGPWIARDSYYGAIVDNDGQGRGWWAIFTGASMFNDLGTIVSNTETNCRIHFNPRFNEFVPRSVFSAPSRKFPHYCRVPSLLLFST